MSVIDRRISQTKRKLKMLVSLFLTFMLSISMMAILSQHSPLSNDAPARIVYTTHAPIYIDGNSSFFGPNASTGISWGNGTMGNPFIIEGWDVDASPGHGIQIQNADVHFVIRNCFIHDGSTNGNTGIYLWNCQNGVLSNNTCLNNYNDIYVGLSNNNTIINNSCSNATNGIALGKSNYNFLYNNICYSNVRSIRLDTSSHNTISRNNCSLNSVYCIELAWSSHYNTVSNNSCLNSGSIDWTGGMQLWEDCNFNILFNNTCINNGNDGIRLVFSCNNNTLSNNTCINNSRYGISLIYSSNGNEISGSLLCNNTYFGVLIDDGSNNTVWNNTLYHNNGAGDAFDSLHIQAFDDGINNSWNSTDGYGNWWSDWRAPDANWDGIVDYPYNITGGSAKDYYPQTVPGTVPEPSIIMLLPLMLIAFLLISRRAKRKE